MSPLIRKNINPANPRRFSHNLILSFRVLPGSVIPVGNKKIGIVGVFSVPS